VGVRRVVPDLTSRSLEDAKGFYSDVLGLQPVMDHGWIVTLQVDDVDACHTAAVRRGAEIVHPLTDEPWGVRRFFVRDPDGHVLNILSHP
jgi:predicted enzyme related to lactoylglutathione lyase